MNTSDTPRPPKNQCNHDACGRDKLFKLADDPRVRLDLGRCARAYAESNFEREAILRRIFGQLDADEQRVADDAIA